MDAALDPAEVSDPAEEPKPRRQSAHRAALALTVAVAALVVAALPFAVRSMLGELFGEQHPTLYPIIGRGEVPPTSDASADTAHAYYNVAAVALDETDGSATFAVSGNRDCPATCPAVELTFLALDDNAAERRGLPPLATVAIAPEDRVFSQSVTLPVRGRPSLYPFDTYEIWLGVAVAVTAPDGTLVYPDLATITARDTITLQSQVAQLVMETPRTIHPSRTVAATDPFALPLVEELRFRRPDYLKIMTALLILLIAVSGGVALTTRAIEELLLGIGTLIVGIWGIRSVLVSQPLPGGTAVDLALSFVILFLLLGLTIRLTRHFYRSSNLRWPHGR